MDYAPNGTLLQQHPRGTRLPLVTIISYVQQIADGLQYAHEKSLIHRDIKPENILFGANYEVLISDFGLAVVAHNTRSLKTEDKNGTPLYMAPEQWQKHPLPASDQYALGIMVYEWLCGEGPFEGGSLQLMHQHIYVDPPLLRSKDPTISLKIEQVVMKALSKDPGQRFESVKQFAIVFKNATQPASTHTTIDEDPQRTVQLESRWGDPDILPFDKMKIPNPLQPSHPPVSKVVSRRNPPSEPKDKDAWYRAGRKAQQDGDPFFALECWEEVLKIDKGYMGSTFKSEIEKLRQTVRSIKIQKLQKQSEIAIQTHNWAKGINIFQELRNLSPLDSEKGHILCLRGYAKQASNIGDWEQEILAWQELLKLVPKDAQALRRNSLAKHNQENSAYYTNAREFLAQGNKALAKEDLEKLWTKAGYYGDPEGLAKKLGMKEEYRKPADYDKEVDKLEESARRTRNGFVKYVLDVIPPAIYVCAFFLISGFGSVIGMLTQSWLWSLGTTTFVGIFAYLLGYRKALSINIFLLITVASYTLVELLIWYMRTLDYSLLYTSQLGFAGSQPLWIGRQIDFGVIYSLIMCGIFVFILKVIYDNNRLEDDFWEVFLGIDGIVVMVIGLFIFGGLGFFWCLPAIAALFGAGFGYGYGWYYSFMVLVSMSLLAEGAIFSISLFTKANQSNPSLKYRVSYSKPYSNVSIDAN